MALFIYFFVKLTHFEMNEVIINQLQVAHLKEKKTCLLKSLGAKDFRREKRKDKDVEDQFDDRDREVRYD